MPTSVDCAGRGSAPAPTPDARYAFEASETATGAAQLEPSVPPVLAISLPLSSLPCSVSSPPQTAIRVPSLVRMRSTLSLTPLQFVATGAVAPGIGFPAWSNAECISVFGLSTVGWSTQRTWTIPSGVRATPTWSRLLRVSVVTWVQGAAPALGARIESIAPTTSATLSGRRTDRLSRGIGSSNSARRLKWRP